MTINGKHVTIIASPGAKLSTVTSANNCTVRAVKEDDSGQPLPHGTYTLTLEFYAEGQQISSASAEIYTRVTEARQHTGEAQVVLAGGVAVPTSSITALREAH